MKLKKVCLKTKKYLIIFNKNKVPRIIIIIIIRLLKDHFLIFLFIHLNISNFKKNIKIHINIIFF